MQVFIPISHFHGAIRTIFDRSRAKNRRFLGKLEVEIDSNFTLDHTLMQNFQPDNQHLYKKL